MEDERALLSRRIDEAADRAALLVLDGHLAAREEPWAQVLRLKVGYRLAKMRPARAPSLLAQHGLPAPDGGWLYRYRIDDAVFAALEAALRGRGSLAALEADWWPALFVLWASAWFRRRYRGGGHRWAELAQALGVTEDQTRFRALTARGLAQWARDVIRAGGGNREYLSSLAREGGFPTAAVEGGGWAGDVLKAIVAPLLADPAPDEARAHALARGLEGRLPQVFRDDDFLQLCGDLALVVVAVRREADGPAARLGLPAGAWLDLNREGWRDTLPLTTDGEAARSLVDMLLQVAALPSGSHAIGVDRLLQRVDGVWKEVARLRLEGALTGDLAAGFDPALGRLRAHAAGDLARWWPGELALVEPPAIGSRDWAVRALSRSTGLRPVPFAATVTLDLRAGTRRAAQITVAGGAPRRGRLLVMAEEGPDLLRVEGSGSGTFRAETVVVQVPEDWSVSATMGESVTDLGQGVGATRLWRVAAGAYVTSPEGDCYRLRTGQDADRRDRVTLVGQPVGWARVAGDVDLFQGPPHVSLSDRSRGRLFRRAIGTRDWRPVTGPLTVGHYEIGWRDDRVLLDKRRIAVIPPGASLSSHGQGDRARFALAGWTGASLVPEADAPVGVTAPDSWSAQPGARPVHRFGAILRWPGDPALAIELDFPLQAGLARWSGRSLPARTRVTLAELDGLVAFDTGHMQLFAELIEPGGGRPPTMAWEFDEEMPMSVPAADIASLLMPASIDAEVRLGMHDGIESYWYVRSFGAKLMLEGNGLVAAEGVVAPGAELVGRSLAVPAREVRFGPYSLVDDPNHRPMQLPFDLAGTWLVYLRCGEAVLSRPRVFTGAAVAEPATTEITRAMALAPRQGLEPALAAVLAQAAGDGPEAAGIVAELTALVTSLRGLPPQTFHILEALPAHPAVLARMAMLASDEERGCVLALSDALPFAWVCIPRTCWDGARRMRFESGWALVQALDDATRYAAEMLAGTEAAIVAREPLLGPVLRPARGGAGLEEITQVFLRRSVDRLGNQGSVFRKALGEALPHYFLQFDAHVLESLDAPCAAALAVAGRWRPAPHHIRRIKTAARSFPTYFAAAFAATLSEQH